MSVISDNSKTPPRVKTSSFTCLSFCLIFILLAPGSQERDEVSISGLRGCNHKSFVKRVLFYLIFKIFLFFFTEQNVEVGISDHPALYVSLCKKKRIFFKNKIKNYSSDKCLVITTPQTACRYLISFLRSWS